MSMGMKSTKQETILVTGATGTLGSEVVKQLSRNKSDVKVKAAVHSNENVKKVQHERVEAIQIDYKKPESLSSAFKGVDKLFLLTHPSPKIPEHELNLVNEAKRSGVRHIVKQSVMGADLNADVEVMRLHRQAEQIIEESGIPYTFLRPNEFMENFVNFHSPSIKSNNAFYSPREDAKVSFVDVRDIAAVAVKVLTDDESDDKHKNKTYLTTGPVALSYYQAAEILSSVTDKKISYVNVLDEVARGAMKETGLNDWLINTISELSAYFRKGNASQVSSTVEEITGKKPISFSQFAKDYAEAFR
jgi:uncharacterized protein YbjT (DUF2867 family)